MSTGIALAIITAGFLICSGIVTAAIILANGVRQIDDDETLTYDGPTEAEWDSIKRAGLR